MSRLLLTLFAILAIFSATTMSTSWSCGPNEVWESCGTACPPTCKDRNPPCTLQCVPGCQCKDDWVRDKGECIPPSKCC